MDFFSFNSNSFAIAWVNSLRLLVDSPGSKWLISSLRSPNSFSLSANRSISYRFWKYVLKFNAGWTSDRNSCANKRLAASVFPASTSASIRDLGVAVTPTRLLELPEPPGLAAIFDSSFSASFFSPRASNVGTKLTRSSVDSRPRCSRNAADLADPTTF